ncbi:MAG TPA: FYDLN acid domain-containing protein [Deltaproteobacteria bacterium]|nr:FYDLN acid domain-containing protein [Deltaproteobacteria bacterium]HOI08522.1 FYDLN acid domain-containing protein [Deltaproteobacteria bacterium]
MADLGKRYKCYKCGTKFYDMNKPQPVCPSCGEDQNIEENKKLLKRKRRRVLSKVKSDIRPMPDDTEDIIETDEEVEEYVLDMEDIVLEENADYSVDD